jgi:hypothetical protein
VEWDEFFEETATEETALETEVTLTPAAHQVLRLVHEAVRKAQEQGLTPAVVCFDAVTWRDLTSNQDVGPVKLARVYGLPVRLFDHLPGYPSGVKLLVR